MSAQPEALRLAAVAIFDRGIGWQAEATAELKRLHAVNADLLEALRALVQNEGLEAFAYLDKGIGVATASGQRWINARAAIRRATGDEA